MRSVLLPLREISIRAADQRKIRESIKSVDIMVFFFFKSFIEGPLNVNVFTCLIEDPSNTYETMQ